MQSIIDLQNTLSELQSMISNTLNPVFTDLQNSSHFFDNIIASQMAITQRIDALLVVIPSLSLLIQNDIDVDSSFLSTPADTSALTQ